MNLYDGVASNIRALEREARENAIRDVKRRIIELGNLNKVSDLRTEVELKLAEIKAQRAAVAQSQLKDIQRSIQFFSGSKERATGLQTSLEEIDALCNVCDGLLKDYPFLQRLHTARCNIYATLEQIDIYNTIADKVSDLSNMLKRDGSQLRFVWTECKKLEKWRDDVLDELKGSLNQQREVEAGKGSGSMRLRKARTAQMTARAIRLLGEHFQLIYNLGCQIRDCLWTSLDNCIELAQYDPIVLRRAVEIVELDSRPFGKQTQPASTKGRRRSLSRSKGPMEKEYLTLTEGSKILEKENMSTHCENSETWPGPGVDSTGNGDDCSSEVNSRERPGGVTSSEQGTNAAARRANEAAEDDSDCSEGDHEDDEEDLRTEFLHQLDRAIERRARTAFREAEGLTTKAGLADGSPAVCVPSLLSAATRLLGDLYVVDSDVCGCFPEEYEVKERFRSGFCSVIEEKILALVDALGLQTTQSPSTPANAQREASSQPLENRTGPTEAAVEEMLQLVEWIDYYNAELALHFDASLASSRLSLASSSIMVYFTSQIETQLRHWIQKIQKKVVAADLETNHRGELYTTFPEDLLNIVQLQVEVARERLSGSRLVQVIKSCSDVLRGHRNDLEEVINSASVERLCAMLNDCDRLQEKIPQLATLVEDKVEEEQAESISDMLYDVGSVYMDVALASTKQIVQRILSELEEEVLQLWFTAQWEEGEPLTEILTVTYSDYFSDLERWMSSEIFFARLVREALESTIAMYINRLCGIDSPFKDLERAAAAMEEDEKMLLSFFNGYADKLAFAGLRTSSAIGDKVHPLSVSRLLLKVSIRPTDRSFDTSSQVKSVLAEAFSTFGEETGAKVISSALRCRTDVDFEQREEVVALFLRLFSNGHLNLDRASRTKASGSHGAKRPWYSKVRHKQGETPTEPHSPSDRSGATSIQERGISDTFGSDNSASSSSKGNRSSLPASLSKYVETTMSKIHRGGGPPNPTAGRRSSRTTAPSNSAGEEGRDELQGGPGSVSVSDMETENETVVRSRHVRVSSFQAFLHNSRFSQN